MLSSTYTPLSLLYWHLKTFNWSMYTSSFNLTSKSGPKDIVHIQTKCKSKVCWNNENIPRCCVSCIIKLCKWHGDYTITKLMDIIFRGNSWKRNKAIKYCGRNLRIVLLVLQNQTIKYWFLDGCQKHKGKIWK